MNKSIDFQKAVEISLDAELFKIVVEHRIDMFELMRCDDLESYNRTNELFPLQPFEYQILKKRGKEIIDGLQTRTNKKK